MGKNGRPSKRTASRRRAIIEALNKGYGLHSAARACGTSPTMVKQWRSQDEDFRRETDEAREYVCDLVEERLFVDAMKGSTLSQLAFLRARRPEYYRARTVIQGDPDAPLEVAHTLNKPRILILPSNDRPAMSEAEIIAEREAISREILNETTLPPAEAEPVQAPPAPEPWPIRLKISSPR
jgi:hypothetical protein